MAATWGLQTWGFENWGTLGDQTFTLSSTNLQASFSVGTISIDADINVGWGGDSWSENAWGELAGVYQDVTGIAATLSIGAESVQANANVDVSGSQLTITNAGITAGISYLALPTGQSLTTSIGNETVGIGADVTGQSLTTTIGTATVNEDILTGAGWGRDTWGNLGWGVNYSAINSTG